MYNELEFPSKLFNMKGFNSINACTVTLLISIVSSVSSRALHEQMTSEERAQTFDTAENLLNYEVLPIRLSHVNKRAVNGHVALELKPFGKHIKLWLEPSDGVLFSDETPIYMARTNQQGILEYAEVGDAMKIFPPWIYKNYESYTTLAVNRDGNRIKRMIGTIGSEKLVIRPIPERLVDDVTRERRSVDNIPESEHDEHHYHIVYETATTTAAEPLVSTSRSKRSIQDTVYPEILTIVDHHLYKVFKKSFQDMIMYLMAFWNGVDMMYRALEHPKYRFHISAIIIAEEDKVLEYIEEHRVGDDYLEFNSALNMSRYWLFDNLPIDDDNYDVAVTMTSLKLCGVIDDTGECEPGTLGVAYTAGTCGVNKYFRHIDKTALVNDNGAFSGVNTAGHELGHSLGANHDGEKSNVRCSEKRGHIMAARTSSTKEWADWSECTLEQFSQFLEVDGTCLLNKPKSGVDLTRLLPGKVKDADDQCKALFGAKADKIDETTCQALWCHKKDNPGRIGTQGPAVDGTSCGSGKLCLHGRCILESLVTY